MSQHICLLLLAVLFVQCAGDPTPKTAAKSGEIPAQNIAADSVADEDPGPAAITQPQNRAAASRKTGVKDTPPKTSAQKPAAAAAPPDAAAEAARRELEAIHRQRLAQAAETARRDSLKKQAPGNRFGNGGKSGPGSGPAPGFSIGDELAARPVVARPKMTDQTQKTGKVVVKVCVDAAGKVVSADYTQRGSTTNDPELRAKAVAWAKEYQFAPTEQAKQCGEIVFNFSWK